MKTPPGITRSPRPPPPKSRTASPSGKACASTYDQILKLFRNLVLEHRAVLHHKSHLLQNAHVLQRVSRHGHNIRKRARRHHADLAFHVQHFRRSRSRGLDRVHRRHSKPNHALEFLRNRLGPRHPAHVRAKHNLQVRVQRFLEAHFMHRGARAVALSSRRIRGRPIAVIRRNRRAIPRALPRHLRDLRVRNLQPVLDRIATAIERALQSDSIVRMARHFLPPPVRLIHHGLQLFQRQGRLRNQIPLLVHPRAMRHVHLDPIRAMLELLPRGLACLHRTVDKLRAFRHLQFRRVTFQVVAARRGNRARGSKNPRPRNRSFLNRLLDLDVAVSCALRFQIAQRCESLLQRPPARKRRARRAQRNPRLQNVFVIAALRGIFSQRKNGLVQTNSPGSNGSRREIDHRSARRNLRRTIRHFFDPLAAHKNQLVLPRRSARSINQRARADDRDALRRPGGSLRANCVRNKHQRKNRQNYALFHLNLPRQRAVACRKAPTHCNTRTTASAAPTGSTGGSRPGLVSFYIPWQQVSIAGNRCLRWDRGVTQIPPQVNHEAQRQIASICDLPTLAVYLQRAKKWLEASGWPAASRPNSLCARGRLCVPL